MGYTTDFEGRFNLDKPLTDAHAAYINAFSGTRRMKRDAAKAEKMPDPVRFAVGLPIGPEGAYFVGGLGPYGQDRDASVTDNNNEPAGQPGLWCQWVPTGDCDGIEWNGTEKFYNYVEWLQYLIANFLGPWGYVVNGRVSWRGEEHSDVGVLVVKNNVVTPRPVTFEDAAEIDGETRKHNVAQRLVVAAENNLHEPQEYLVSLLRTAADLLSPGVGNVYPADGQLRQEHPTATAERQRVLNLLRAAAKRYAGAPHTLYTSQLLLEEIERIEREH